MNLSQLTRRLKRLETRRKEDVIAAMDRLLTFYVSTEDRAILTRHYPDDLIPPEAVPEFRAALVDLLSHATDRERRLLTDLQQWIDEHEDAEPPAPRPEHLADAGQGNHPGVIRIFESWNYETEEEMEAAIEAHRQEQGVGGVDVTRDGKGKVTHVVVRVGGRKEQETEPEPEPKQELVKVRPVALLEEATPAPKAEPRQPKPKRAKPKSRQAEPQPEPKPMTKQERRQDAFERWKRGENVRGWVRRIYP